MAVRRPLVLDGDNNFIEMTDAQIVQVRDRVRYLYGGNPSVTLSVVSSGGSLGTISDTRKKSGPAATSVSSYPSTSDPVTVTVNYAKTDQSAANTDATADTNNRRFPIYYNSTNEALQAMTLTDFRDTFILPAIDTLTSAAGQPGIYRVHTSTSLSGYTNVSGTAIFSDTRANTSSYAASSIGTSGTHQDHPTTITNYYLMRANQQSTAPTHGTMLYIRSDDDIQQYTQSGIDTLLENEVRHCASEVSGTRIRYTYGGTGTNLGSGMSNTILNGNGNRQTRFVNANDYRAQEFPNGSAITSATTYLKVNQT